MKIDRSIMWTFVRVPQQQCRSKLRHWRKFVHRVRRTPLKGFNFCTNRSHQTINQQITSLAHKLLGWNHYVYVTLNNTPTPPPGRTPQRELPREQNKPPPLSALCNRRHAVTFTLSFFLSLYLSSFSSSRWSASVQLLKWFPLKCDNCFV